MRLIRSFVVAIAPVLFGVAAQSQPASQMRAPQAKWTALDRYVAQPDPAYQYSLVQTVAGDGYTTYVIELTSQNWLTTAEVDRPLWKHWLTIVKPDKVASTTGLVIIAGGGNGGRPPARPDPMLTFFALSTNSVVSEIRMIPNQALTFVDDGKPRKEDALIAYTWDKFLRTGDSRWPARLPMTKAVVRAFDTITEFCGSKASNPVKVEHFVVAGGSKRGWTTWTT
ncbi:MAG: PhoPQ-activated protein PqaA family protein, partial [Acidobacteria bacterium]|nr:PhoPQ-activated protein PqaA family protein [Acidobacteriota bacterium]